MEIEGENLDLFIQYIFQHLPTLSETIEHHTETIPVQNSEGFLILPSEHDGKSDLLVSPDMAVCENCKKEFYSPGNRRFHYPFINCSDCGPRLSITRDLPCDRPQTTMAKFPMCNDCRHEYENPLDHRYHDQPISCYCCGPVLALYNCRTSAIETRMADPLAPLKTAAVRIKQHDVVAIKGVGGYHLACLSSSDHALDKLRKYKKLERKPFALMATLEMIKKYGYVSATEEKHLLSSAAPILLLERKAVPGISSMVAPDQEALGFMLPYTPIHILLLAEVGEPLVMTSANFPGEPIIYQDVFQALRELCDFVLTHDREIHFFSDDSVARVIEERLYMIRRSRGYVPFPISFPVESHGGRSRTVLALGPMLKNTFTFVKNGKAITSPHIGNIQSPYSLEVERMTIQHYMNLFSFSPGVVAIDKHPGYPNRLLAREFKDAQIVEIQHHKAHVASLLAEKQINTPVIGIAMDGMGYGDDGKIWGGEFFIGDSRELERFGHLKNLYLPSGDLSVKEPWRFALSILVSLYGTREPRVKEFAGQFGEKGEKQLWLMESGLAGLGVLTSSCGRLFDAAASLVGIAHNNTFDGDLPLRLQHYAHEYQRKQQPINNRDLRLYDFSIEHPGDTCILNLLPMLDGLVRDNRPVEEKAFCFHSTLVAGMVRMAEIARDVHQIHHVGLTGGVFQNPILLELAMKQLQEKGFRVWIHSHVPANDGGISIGQALLAYKSIF